MEKWQLVTTMYDEGDGPILVLKTTLWLQPCYVVQVSIDSYGIYVVTISLFL